MSELNRLSQKEFKESTKIPVIVVLDNIRSLTNIGSFFRTSDAFRVKAIYLCGITATPPHREIRKTALGATESVDWRYFDTTLEALTELKSEGAELLAIEQTKNSIELHEFEISSPSHPLFALIFGNEVEGVSEEVISASDYIIEIPQAGTKHSLNVSTCGGIILWEFFKKLRN